MGCTTSLEVEGTSVPSQKSLETREVQTEPLHVRVNALERLGTDQPEKEQLRQLALQRSDQTLSRVVDLTDTQEGKWKDEHLLETATLETALKFPPPHFRGKCLSVYDGDTFTLGMILNGKVYRFQVRTFGYDSPEIRTRDPAEKKAGLEAKRVMESRILGKMLDLENKGQDKYGRLLLTVRDSEGEVNEWMVRNGYGRPYFGKKKEAFVAKKETTILDENVEIEFVD